jgi:Chromosome segregation ATPases
MFIKDEIELELEDKKAQLKCLEDKVEAMSKAQGSLMGENKRLQEELTKGSFQLSTEKKNAALLDIQVQDLKRELSSANAAKMASIESSSATPVIQDLERQLQESKEKREELEGEKKHLKELLDEAGQDFLEKSEEVQKINRTLKDCEQQLVQQAIALNELNSQLEESRLLLTDSATRMEEKEKTIADLEDQADKRSSMEEELTQKIQEVESRLQISESEKQVLSDKITQHDEEIAN